MLPMVLDLVAPTSILDVGAEQALATRRIELEWRTSSASTAVRASSSSQRTGFAGSTLSIGSILAAGSTSRSAWRSPSKFTKPRRIGSSRIYAALRTSSCSPQRFRVRATRVRGAPERTMGAVLGRPVHGRWHRVATVDQGSYPGDDRPPRSGIGRTLFARARLAALNWKGSTPPSGTLCTPACGQHANAQLWSAGSAPWELLRHLPQALDRAIRVESSAFRHLWANATRYWLARTAAQGARPGRAGSLSPRGGPNAARPVDARAVPAGWKFLLLVLLGIGVCGPIAAWRQAVPTAVTACLRRARASNTPTARARTATSYASRRAPTPRRSCRAAPSGSRSSARPATHPQARQQRIQRDIRRAQPRCRGHAVHRCVGEPRGARRQEHDVHERPHRQCRGPEGRRPGWDERHGPHERRVRQRRIPRRDPTGRRGPQRVRASPRRPG